MSEDTWKTLLIRFIHKDVLPLNQSTQFVKNCLAILLWNLVSVSSHDDDWGARHSGLIKQYCFHVRVRNFILPPKDNRNFVPRAFYKALFPPIWIAHSSQHIFCQLAVSTTDYNNLFCLRTFSCSCRPLCVCVKGGLNKHHHHYSFIELQTRGAPAVTAATEAIYNFT